MAVTLLTLGATLLVGMAGLACGDETPTAPRSLYSPSGVAVSRTCKATIDGRLTTVSADRCDEGGDITSGTTSSRGLVANRQRQSLMVANLDAQVPAFIDQDTGEPSITGIPICNGPRDVAVTPDGFFALVLCDVSQALSVVAVPSSLEVLRLQRGAVETDMAAAPDQPRFAFPRPDLNQVVVEHLAFDCDGSTDSIPSDCIPQVSVNTELTLNTPGSPRYVSFAGGGRLLVVYRDRGFLSVFALDAQAEASCLDSEAAPPCESARIGLTFECTNGLDDDGDGLIDQADLQCYGAEGAESPEGLRGFLSACTDGIDNDGDTQVDHDDLDCLSALDEDEGGGVRPFDCEDDTDCIPLPLDGFEDTDTCANGVDDDGDGLADRHDPGCDDPADGSEEAAPPVCMDTVDNDGDGLTDTADPDCYGPTGLRENTPLVDGYGPLTVQRNEEYALVVDRARRQVLVVDLEAGQLLDAGDGDPLHSGLGIMMTRSAVQRPLGYTLKTTTTSDDNVETGLDEEIVIVPASDGLGTIVVLRNTVYSGVEEGRVEGIDFPMEPRDGNATPARVSALDCAIPEDFQAAIRTARQTAESVRIRCSDPEVPQLQPVDGEDTVHLTSVERFTIEDGAVVTEEVPHDWQIRSDDWTVTFEGVIPATDRSDGLIHEGIDGLLVSAGANFCGLGIEAGDHVVIEAATPSLDADPAACTAFQGEQVLEYGIEFVRADALYLSILADVPGVVQSLPTRECFAAGFKYVVRPSGTWVVAGETSGFYHPWTSLSEQCVARTHDGRWDGRLVEGERFVNPFFALELGPGTVARTRDTAISFSVTANFSTTALGVGPMPVDIEYAETTRGPRILLSDGGTNVLYLFNALTWITVAAIL